MKLNSGITCLAPFGRFTVALWCDGHPVILCGLEELPRVGYRFEANAGEWWEVVEDSESLREPERA
jgi:hypothetical protein